MISNDYIAEAFRRAIPVNAPTWVEDIGFEMSTDAMAGNGFGGPLLWVRYTIDGRKLNEMITATDAIKHFDDDWRALWDSKFWRLREEGRLS